MNDCLLFGEGARQTPDAALRAAFEAAFAVAPDLADLSYSARRVLVEAATLFHRDGAAATSVRDVARACGVTPGALYRHFASKDDLLYRLVRHGQDSIESDLVAVSSTDDPLERVTAFIGRYVRRHLDRPEVARLTRREYRHLAAPRRREIVERRRAVRDRFAAMLSDGAAGGRLVLIDGPDAATRTAVMVLDMCSRTSEWYDPRRASAEAPDALAERYVQASLRLLGTR